MTRRRLPLAIVAVLAAAAGAAIAGLPTILPNGSFEEGRMEPQGWHMGTGGEWASGHARSGGRSIGGASRAETILWSNEPIPLEAGQSYRLDGWLNVRRGTARLAVEFLGADGTAIATASTTSASAAAAGWQYVAVERDAPGGATSARLQLIVRGEAYLDDAALVPLAANMLFNPIFDGDNRGRVSFWDEDPLIVRPGMKAGRHGADVQGGRTGSALVIQAETAWWAVRNVSSPMPMGLTTFRLSGWARAQRGAPQIGIMWLDFGGTILRIDPATPRETVDGWTRYEATGAAPENADVVTASIVVDHGKAWFDDFDLRPVAPATNRRPVVRVHVNQVGYETRLPKSFVVATNFVPESGDGGAATAEVAIIAADGREALRVPLVPSGRINGGTAGDWDAYFWRADFSDLRAPGTYRAIARIGTATGESPTFRVGDDVLFDGTAELGVDFFFVQRCGFDVPGWHRPCHLDDAKLPDGRHIDATGGWHSAGDYNKLMYENGDGGGAYALLEAYDAAPGRFAASDRDGDGLVDLLDEAKWGADFVAKMQVPETGGLYKDVSQGPGRDWMKWSPPDVHTDNVVGTADDPVIMPGEGYSPLVIAAWMRLAKLLDERGVRTDYRDRAVRYWNYVTGGGTKGYGPHLSLSAVAMYRDTGDSAYLGFARRSVEAMLASQAADGRRAGAFGAYGEHAAGALATFALAFPDDPLAARIRPALDAWTAFAASTADNPFGLAKQSVGEPEFFFEPTSALGHNFEIFGRAWAALLIYRLTRDERAARYAADQLDWVFGKNPYGLCMFEGAGTVNPPRYHHRYDSIPGHETGAVPGAVPNGFVRSVRATDQPGFDLSRSRREKLRVSYRTSEPWLVHNMWHLLAMAELRRATEAH